MCVHHGTLLILPLLDCRVDRTLVLLPLAHPSATPLSVSGPSILLIHCRTFFRRSRRTLAEVFSDHIPLRMPSLTCIQQCQVENPIDQAVVREEIGENRPVAETPGGPASDCPLKRDERIAVQVGYRADSPQATAHTISATR